MKTALLLTVAAMAGAAACDAGETLARGEVQGSILILDPAPGTAALKTGDTLAFAASELSRYLQAITSKEYPLAHGTNRGAPATAAHLAQLTPLVTKEHLDKIEGLVSQTKSVAAEPYRSRIDQQTALWKVARLDTKAMADTMTAMLRMRDFRGGRLSEADRQRTIALSREAIANINQVGELLLTSPETLRGPCVFRAGGAVGGERIQSYVARPKAWLRELQQPPAAKPPAKP